MIPLGETYKKHGFHYEQVLRRGQYAIFQQRLRPGVGCLAFEVIRIQRDEDRVIADRLIPAHEHAPGDEQWGRHGWTFPTLEAARAKLRALEQADEERAEAKARKGEKMEGTL